MNTSTPLILRKELLLRYTLLYQRNVSKFPYTFAKRKKKKECRFFRVKNFDTNTDGITELSIFSSSGHPIQNQRVRFSWIYIWLLYIASVLRVLTRTRSSILNVLKGL